MAPKALRERLRNDFITGLLVLGPVAATTYVVYALVTGLDGLFPHALRPVVLGLPLPGLGLLLACGLTLLIGELTRNLIGHRVVEAASNALERVPILGKTYGVLRQVVDAMSGRESFHRAVLVEFPRAGSYTVAFVTAAQAPDALTQRAGRPLLSVFVPTTPNPTSGYYLLVDEAQTVPLDLTVDQALKIVLTMGMIPGKGRKTGEVPALTPGRTDEASP